MLELREQTWSDDAGGRTRYRSLARTRTNRFDLLKAPNPRLSVAGARFEQSGINLFQIETTGYAIDLVDCEELTLFFPERGRVEVDVEQWRHIARSGDVFGLGPSRRRTLVKPEDGEICKGYLIKLPARSQPLLGIGGPLLPVSNAPASVMADLIRYLMNDLAADTPLLHRDRFLLLAEALLEEHLRIVFDAVSKSVDCTATFSRKAVRQADEFMHEHFSEPLRLADIASAAGVGVRDLQAAYRKATGQTPWTRLTFIRLKEARSRLLLERDATVSTIALDCGFTHMGRFSKLYRATYDELPSETLRRAKR